MRSDCMSKFAGLSLECVAAQAHAEVGKAIGRVLKNKAPARCLDIEDQMKLLHEARMFSSSSEFQPLSVQLQLTQNKVFHGTIGGNEALGGLDVISVKRSDGSSCYLFMSSEFARLCADMMTPGRRVRWTSRASPPLIPDTLTPLFSPGESFALVLTPHISDKDALLVELLNVGDLGSACVATVVQVMQPKNCSKYRAGLVRVMLYIHNCSDCDGAIRSDCRGILLLWDRQHGIAALFEEGDTLLLQFPVWVSSYDADDIAEWACGATNPILLEVGPQSVIFVHPAELTPVNLPMTAGQTSLLHSNPHNDNTLMAAHLRSLPVHLHSCSSARITVQPVRLPVAITVVDALDTEIVVCPRIEALDLTFVHALPLPMLLCDAAAGMRGLCCVVQILSFESVCLESVASAQVASSSPSKVGIIIHGEGKGSHVCVSRVESCSKEKSICDIHYCMYKICDGWGLCQLILPRAMFDPSMLLHKTVLLYGFDCRELVANSCSDNCEQMAQLYRPIVLMPHTSCRVLPITLNIGLALSAAVHNSASAVELLAVFKSMLATGFCSKGWVSTYAVEVSLKSVLEETGAAHCSVLLQDKMNREIRLPCSTSHYQLQAIQLLPLVGSSVVCVLSLDRFGEYIQVEGIYRC